MENLSLIAAIGKNRELGKNSDLIWHLKEDMNFFRITTNNKTIIMGRKCFESLFKVLPNRKHIVLTNNKEYKNSEITIMNTKEEVLEYVKNTKEECFIIGGAKIYELFLPYCNKLYLTEIDDEKDADVFFPEFNKELYDSEILDTKEEDNTKYSFVLYRRKNDNSNRRNRLFR